MFLGCPFYQWRMGPLLVIRRLSEGNVVPEARKCDLQKKALVAYYLLEKK